jgi:hypothetical protein
MVTDSRISYCVWLGQLWKSLMRAHIGDYERLEAELRRAVARWPSLGRLPAVDKKDIMTLDRLKHEPKRGGELFQDGNQPLDFSIMDYVRYRRR